MIDYSSLNIRSDAKMEYRTKWCKYDWRVVVYGGSNYESGGLWWLFRDWAPKL